MGFQQVRSCKLKLIGLSKSIQMKKIILMLDHLECFLVGCPSAVLSETVKLRLNPKEVLRVA